jgi:hypothetical protein
MERIYSVFGDEYLPFKNFERVPPLQGFGTNVNFLTLHFVHGHESYRSFGALLSFGLIFK